MQRITLDYGNVLDSAVGPAHGLSPGQIERAATLAQAAVTKIEQERPTGKHRYRGLPFDHAAVEKIQAAAARHSGFDNLVVLGIGGSALGNIALQTALNHPFYNLLPPAQRRGPRLFVMDNVDPVQFAGLLELLSPALDRTLFNVISKSGETAETAAQFLIVRDMLSQRIGRDAARRQILVTTDAHAGTMRDLVQREGHDSLAVPDGVGGRFTVLSAVGLFSAAVCGINIRELIAGAAEMDGRISEPAVSSNPAAMLALLLYLFYTSGKRLHVMMPYSYQLKDFADWYRQLWAESLGKNRDLEGRPVVIGPTPIRALGATDQHSQIQLYREGPNDKVVIFLEVESFAADVRVPSSGDLPESLAYLEGSSLARLLNAEKLATEYALVASQRPCLTLRFPAVNARTVGQFILLMEAAATIMGQLLNINAYDQPAVQLGKEAAFALMGRRGFEEQARKIGEWSGSRGKHVV